MKVILSLVIPTVLVRELVGELMREHLHVVHLLVVVQVPPHGGGELGVEHDSRSVFLVC